MAIEALNCPHCGAPLPAAALRGVVECGYCDRALRLDGERRWIDAPLLSGEAPEGRWRADGAEKVRVGDRRFVVLGRIAEGDGSDVFLARSDSRLTELVVLKVPRDARAQALLERSHHALQRLARSDAQGAEFFSALLPQAVTYGPVREREGVSCAVHRWRSGFVHTFEDALAAHPGGVDGKALVWIWKRTLELLGWVHRAGYVHGAVLPPHVLLHARDHGVTLVGWSAVTERSESSRAKIPVTSERFAWAYPRAQWSGAPATPRSDLTMLARSLLVLAGGDRDRLVPPPSLPAPIAALLEAYLDEDHRARSGDAWALKEEVGAAGRAAYGPPRFSHFQLPGWR